jgi:hypothetical protein
MPHQRAAALAFALLVWSVPAYAEKQTIASAEALERWVSAVNAHVPGRPDAAVATIAAMTWGSRSALNKSYPLLIGGLRARGPRTLRTVLEYRIDVVARTIQLNPGAQPFLKRAAILHFDTVVFIARFPEPPDDAPWVAEVDFSRRRRSGVDPETPPLLTNRRTTLTRDGRIVGVSPVNWNLPFARSLLDELLKQAVFEAPAGIIPATDPFVGQWYHAVSAYLFAKGMNGDATSHLADAARVLSGDARALFDRATFAEVFGLPIYQAVQDEADPRRYEGTGIPAEAKTNAEAERLYREVLAADATYVEARVRLARLIARRGAYEEAAAEIERALDAAPPNVTGYYAHLVAGRIASARAQYGAALRHYAESSSRYPQAQAARLGASHAALMSGSVADALPPLEGLGAAAIAEADPWLDYRLGAGRDVNELVAALWKASVW